MPLQTMAAFLASPPADHPALCFTVFINHDSSMIANLSDAISSSGCNLRPDESRLLRCV